MNKNNFNLRIMVAIAICLAVSEKNMIAQNYQINITKQGNHQYDVNVTKNRYKTIDFNNGANLTSYTPTYVGGVDLNTVSRAGDALTKMYYENQNMYFRAYNQLQSLPTNNNCQQELKNKLLNEFEKNVYRYVGEDRWFDADVRKAIMVEAIRINTIIGDSFDNPCVVPDILRQIQDLFGHGEYQDAFSLYTNNQKVINRYLMTFTSDFGRYQETVIYPLFENVYDKETAIRKYAEDFKPELTYAKNTSSNDAFVFLYYKLMNGYDKLNDWNESIDICKEGVKWAINKGKVDYAISCYYLAIRYYMIKDKESSLMCFKEAQNIFKQLNMKKSQEYKISDKMIKIIKKNNFSLSLGDIRYLI